MKYRLLVDPSSKLALRVEALLKKGWSVFGDPVFCGEWTAGIGKEPEEPYMAQALVLLSPKTKGGALTSVGDRR